MANNFTLPELAEYLEPQAWAANREALSVIREGVAAPNSWRPELAAQCGIYIAEEFDRRASKFETSDFLVAVTYLRHEGVDGTSIAFDRWKGRTSDWREALDQLRISKREEYLDHCRRDVADQAPKVALSIVAGAKANESATKINAAVLSSITAPGAEVVATGVDGQQRQIRRAELIEAKLNILGNALETEVSPYLLSRLWRYVEISLPAKALSHDPASIAPVGADLQQQFDTEMRRRVATRTSGPEGYRDPMLGWAQRELQVAPAQAEALWTNRAAEFPRTAGRRKTRTVIRRG